MQDLFRGLVGTVFYLLPSITHDVVIHGRENLSDHHPTIVISNHKRDLDSLVLVGIIYTSRGFAHPNREMVFALREDAFWEGFVGSYVGRFPLKLTVKPHLQLLKAYPMGMLRSRRDRARIRAQLDRLAGLLDRGRDLYWTPEGGLALDGRLDRFRAGLYRLIQTTHAPLRLLPVAIFYDFTTTTRTRCFIRLGSEILIDRSLSRAEIERQARQAILRQMTINAGHLLVAVLRRHSLETYFSQADLEQAVLEEALRLDGGGLALDGRLSMRWSFRWRLRRLLGYAAREHILQRSNAGWSVQLGLNHPQMQYVLNELDDAERTLGLKAPGLAP